MDPSALGALRRLLLESRVLALSVEVDDEPTIGLLPFLAASDLQSLLVHVSKLARHTKGLVADAPFSALVHEPDSADADPMALPRLTVRGRVELVGAEERDRVAAAWAERFSSAVLTLELGDFEFRRLRIEGGRLIRGFAQASGVRPETLAAAAALDRSAR